MAKTTGPLMSLDASGSIASTLTYSKWKGRNYVRQLVKPSNPKSPAQTAFRAMFGFLSTAWKNISAPNQATWDALAATRNVSPFNAYTRENQRRWTQVQAPGQADPIGGTGTASTITGVTGTGGVRQAQLDVDLGAGAQQWGLITYRNTVSGFSPAQNDVVAVQEAAPSATTTFIDSGLSAGTYYYRHATFSTDGNLLPYGTETPVTVS